jgi:hypothetical protein
MLSEIAVELLAQAAGLSTVLIGLVLRKVDPFLGKPRNVTTKCGKIGGSERACAGENQFGQR